MSGECEIDSDNRSFCNGCQSRTRHRRAGTIARRFKEESQEFVRAVMETWTLLQCQGCDAIKVCVTQDCPDFKEPNLRHFPQDQLVRAPGWSQQLPKYLQRLTAEIYLALNSECLCLATMGTRSIIDTMLSEMIPEVDGFAKRLTKAVERGFLTSQQGDRINSAIEAGHAAAHRQFQPTVDQLNDVLEIVKHSLKEHYILKAASDRLDRGVPHRNSGGRDGT